jgi:hypothetical protein
MDPLQTPHCRCCPWAGSSGALSGGALTVRSRSRGRWRSCSRPPEAIPRPDSSSAGCSSRSWSNSWADGVSDMEILKGEEVPPARCLGGSGRSTGPRGRRVCGAWSNQRTMVAGRVRYRLSDIEAYEKTGFVSREPAGTTSFGDPSDVRETVARLIRSLGS